MAIIKKNKARIDENGRTLTAAEVETIRQEVTEELENELADTGFEGHIKRFVAKKLNK